MADFQGLDLERLQHEIGAYLSSDAWFDNIPVLIQAQKDLASAYDAALAGTGMVVIVITPTASVNQTNLPSVVVEDIPILITVTRNRTLHPEGPGALKTGQVIWALLHHWIPPHLYDDWDTPDGEAGRPKFALLVKNMVQMMDPQDASREVYGVNLTTRGAWWYQHVAGNAKTQQTTPDGNVPLTTGPVGASPDDTNA